MTALTAVPPRNRHIALWVLQVLLAAAFLAAGGAKLLGLQRLVAVFDGVGIGQWFRFVTGGIEVVSAVLLLVPSLCGFGAALLVPTMVGAVLTHLFLIGGSPVAALVLLLLCATVAWNRRERGLGWLLPVAGSTR